MLDDGRKRLDLFVTTGGDRCAYELKYPRAPFTAELDAEPVPFHRAHQDAEDFARYYIAEDIRRIERLVEEGLADAGCVVVLTNISSLWRQPRQPTKAQDAAFRIHEEAVLTGTLEWGPLGQPKDPVPLTGSYSCRWRDYSELDHATGAAAFRYLLLAA